MTINHVIKKVLMLVLIGFTTLSYAAFSASDFPSSYHFNGQTWKLGFKDSNDKVAIAEYVINNENVNNWTQLFTYQVFFSSFPAGTTPLDLASATQKQLEQMKLDYEFVTLDANKREAFIEFKIKSPAKDQQDEIQRIILTEDNKLIILHYVIKKPDMGDSERMKWIANLKDLKLLPTP